MFSGNLIFNLSITLTSQQLTLQPPVDHRTTCWPFNGLLTLEPATDLPASRPSSYHLLYKNSQQLIFSQQAIPNYLLTKQPAAYLSSSSRAFSSR